MRQKSIFSESLRNVFLHAGWMSIPISISIAYIFLTASLITLGIDEARDFEAVLVEQKAKQLAENFYSLEQTFTFDPLPMMGCNTISRVITDYQPWILSKTYLIHLNGYCQEIPKLHYQAYMITAFVLFMSSALVYLCIYKKPINVFTKYTLPIIIVTSICGYSLLVLLFTGLLSIGAPMPEFKGNTTIKFYQTFIEADFSYCHWINGTVTNGYLVCDDVLYKGECFPSYIEAIYSPVDSECFFNSNCMVTYPTKIKLGYIIIMSIASILALVSFILVTIILYNMIN